MYCDKKNDDDRIQDDAEPHGLSTLPGLDCSTLFAIHHWACRPGTMAMHRALRIILTHDTSISRIAWPIINTCPQVFP